MNFKISIFLISFFPQLCRAQSDNDGLLGQIMEHIAENSSEDMDYSEVTDQLAFYMKYPLDINKVEKEQLKELLFISPVQIDQLLLHRKNNGLFHDLLEIQSINGFDNEITRWLMNFIVVKPTDLLANVSLEKLFTKSNHDILVRFGKILEKQKGYMPSDSAGASYIGSSDRLFARYRFNYNNKLSFSLNMEKDAGEAFIRNSAGFDFYSANLFLKGEGFVRKVVVGDYGLQSGQGLTMWSGLGFGKGAGITSVAKQALGVRPYSSANESSFLRGAAATFSYRSLTATPFFSAKNLDGSLTDDGREINALPISGMHRTAAERTAKNTVLQTVYGISTGYLKNDLNCGFLVYRTELDRSVSPGSSLYEQYDFSNKSLTNLGFHYTYTHRNTYFFGEAAHSLSSGSAFLHGLMSSLSSRLSAVLLYRNYARNYHSFFNQGLSESTRAVNENGFYTGFMIKFNSKFEVITYVDFFKFPWLKFRVDAPSQGNELFTQLVFSLGKRFKAVGRFKRQQKEENATGDTALGIVPVVKQTCRLEIAYKATSSLSFRTRTEISSYKKGLDKAELGFLSYQDVIYKPLASKFSGNLRFAIFQTASFSSRIYAYENDVLYGYSVPAYHGQGIRWYVNGRYTLYRGCDIWLRYSVTSSSDGQESIGSGNDMISGRRKSDIKLQLRFQF